MKALLIGLGDEKNTKVIDISNGEGQLESMRKAIGCRNIEQIPHDFQLKRIDTKDGDVIEYELWVDEEGFCNNLGRNLCATITAYPLEFYGIQIYGPCIMIRTNGKENLDLNDWKNICDTLYYNDEWVDKNIINNGPDSMSRIAREISEWNGGADEEENAPPKRETKKRRSTKSKEKKEAKKQRNS